MILDLEKDFSFDYLCLTCGYIMNSNIIENECCDCGNASLKKVSLHYLEKTLWPSY